MQVAKKIINRIFILCDFICSFDKTEKTYKIQIKNNTLCRLYVSETLLNHLICRINVLACKYD